MKPRDLILAGEVLYGRRWKVKLGQDIGVSTRTLREYAKGATPIPKKVALAVQARLYSQDWPEFARKIRGAHRRLNLNDFQESAK